MVISNLFVFMLSEISRVSSGDFIVQVIYILLSSRCRAGGPSPGCNALTVTFLSGNISPAASRTPEMNLLSDTSIITSFSDSLKSIVPGREKISRS